jgi:hypothetical protein
MPANCPVGSSKMPSMRSFFLPFDRSARAP